MEHAIHLSAGHFIQVVSPTSAHILVKKIKKAFHDAQLDDTILTSMLWKLTLEMMMMMMIMLMMLMTKQQILLLVILSVNPLRL